MHRRMLPNIYNARCSSLPQYYQKSQWIRKTNVIHFMPFEYLQIWSMYMYKCQHCGYMYAYIIHHCLSALAFIFNQLSDLFHNRVFSGLCRYTSQIMINQSWVYCGNSSLTYFFVWYSSVFRSMSKISTYSNGIFVLIKTNWVVNEWDCLFMCSKGDD
jgi:hypothetical protein